MSNIIPSAAPQQTPVALNHLAPVVDLLSRSLANPKSEQGAGARRWQMLKDVVARAYCGAKSALALIGLTAVGAMMILTLQGDGGEHALLEPEVNIQVGAQILREYKRRFGDTETALQMYAGAFDEPSSQYANKVFAELARLEALRQKAKKPQSV